MDWMGPYVIPVVALLIPIVAIAAGAWERASRNRLIADQRMAMLARGIPLAEIEATLQSPAFMAPRNAEKDPLRTARNVRRAGVVLVASGIGLVVFGLLLAQIVRERDVFVVAAAGLIPLAIGIGLLVDYVLERRQLARLGIDAIG